MSRDYFNSIAPQWDDMINHDMTKIEYLMSKVGLNSSHTVLDVGSGTGVLLPLLKKCQHVTECDFSEEMQSVARTKHGNTNITYLNCDVYDVTAKFDVIILFSVLPHFEEDKTRIIKHLTSLLNDKGSIAIAHSSSRDFINRMHSEIESVSEARLPSIIVLTKIFANCGLEVTEQIDDNEQFFILAKKL